MRRLRRRIHRRQSPPGAASLALVADVKEVLLVLELITIGGQIIRVILAKLRLANVFYQNVVDRPESRKNQSE